MILGNVHINWFHNGHVGNFCVPMLTITLKIYVPDPSSRYFFYAKYEELMATFIVIEEMIEGRLKKKVRNLNKDINNL